MKKLITCAFAIILCLTLSVSSFAANNSDELNTNTFIDTVESKIADILGAVELQKADYGLRDVDFSALSLGREIPSYELTESGLARINDIHYFPIIYNNNWIATAIVSYSIYGDMNIGFSAKYAADYSVLKNSIDTRISSARDGAALVFDRTNGYLYLGDESIVVESYQEIQDRESMNTYTGTVCPKTAQVVAQRYIDIMHLELTRDNDVMVSLNISPIIQPTDVTCWAASTAMILNYRGTSATVNSVVAAAGVSMDDFQNAIQCNVLISSSFNYRCGTYGNSYGYHDYYLTMNALIAELCGFSSPLFASFGAEPGHAVVVKGYVNLGSTPTMTYIDPDDGYIKASTVPANGAVTITYSGSAHSLNTAFAVYEQ